LETLHDAMTTTYKDSGVDLELYEQAMQKLPALMRRTFTPRVVRNDGGFAGLYALDFAKSIFSRNYEEPILVSGTDGVGTKLQVAQMMGRHDTIGIDLVAMCVNDVLCVGAEPLFFLDYIAMGRDNPPLLEAVVRGISDGCIKAECSLLGGETAIMPSHYHGDMYDVAGFCVGVVEKKRLVSGQAISPGDVILGVSSSGFHSNGFSLVRKVVFDKAKLDVDTYVSDLGMTVGEALLTPTVIYSELVRSVLSRYKVKNVVHGIGHITGGGLLENTERILPPHVDLVFDRGTWDVPAVFPWLAQLGQIEPKEMEHVFNMGLGLVFIVSEHFADSIQGQIRAAGHNCSVIGRATSGSGKSRYST
jgi:phosphoribosylformylglycinamidine cyclo-ligase